LFIVAPVFAQETTPEPTAPPAVTPAPVGGSNDLAISGAQLAAYIVLSLVAGGGVLAVFYRVLDNKDVQGTVEKLYESWNPETQQTIITILNDYKEVNARVMTFLDKVTNGETLPPPVDPPVVTPPA
jgi:hypothetical protein